MISMNWTVRLAWSLGQSPAFFRDCEHGQVPAAWLVWSGRSTASVFLALGLSILSAWDPTHDWTPTRRQFHPLVHSIRSFSRPSVVSLRAACLSSVLDVFVAWTVVGGEGKPYTLPVSQVFPFHVDRGSRRTSHGSVDAHRRG